MRKSPCLALVSAGAVSQSPLARFRSLGDLVKLVKAPTFRQASRIANTLRHAVPVRTASEVADTECLFLWNCRAPEVLAVHSDWKDRLVIVCGAGMDSRDIAAFAQRGAATASLTPLDFFSDRHFAVEGAPAGVLATRKLLEGIGARLLPVEAGRQPLVEASLQLGTTVLMALLEAATVNLRQAGIPLTDARAVVERVFVRSVRAHQKGGSKAWRQPRETADRLKLERATEALRSTDPSLHRLFEDMLTAALHFGGGSGDQTFGLGGGRSRAGQAD